MSMSSQFRFVYKTQIKLSYVLVTTKTTRVTIDRQLLISLSVDILMISAQLGSIRLGCYVREK